MANKLKHLFNYVFDPSYRKAEQLFREEIRAEIEAERVAHTIQDYISVFRGTSPDESRHAYITVSFAKATSKAFMECLRDFVINKEIRFSIKEENLDAFIKLLRGE